MWRRWIVFPAAIFLAYEMETLKYAPDTRVNDTLAFAVSMAFVAIILIYAGLATAQDIAAIWATRSGLPYSPDSSPADNEEDEVVRHGE